MRQVAQALRMNPDLSCMAPMPSTLKSMSGGDRCQEFARRRGATSPSPQFFNNVVVQRLRGGILARGR